MLVFVTRLSFYVLLYPNFAFIVSCHLEDEGRDGKRKKSSYCPAVCAFAYLSMCSLRRRDCAHEQTSVTVSVGGLYSRSVTGVLTG